MKFLTEIVETILRTAQVENDKPVSALLVGPSGGGKSQTVIRFQAPWIHHTNDITTAGLADILLKDREGKLRAIVLPDFNVPLSHKSSVVTLTVSNLLSMMSEGTVRFDDGRQEKEIKHAPIGIVSACTPDMYHSHYKKWLALGFIRRFLVLNYTYNLETRRAGNDSIRRGKVTSNALPTIPLDKSKTGKRMPVVIPPEQAGEIEKLSHHLARHQGMKISRDYKSGSAKFDCKEPALEFAPHLVLQAVAKGNALRNHRRKVNEDDIQFLLRLLAYTDPSNPCSI